ncbi:MAG: coproporphyrinogen-III oxidase family protein, partial [Terriglobia bacterium]
MQPKELEREYLVALQAEMAAHRWAWRPDTVFLGGGTPSAMEPAQIAAIMNCLPGTPWREATLEAAPGSLTEARIQAWQQAGINRISLGVQSFNKAELARTGRRHDSTTVAADLTLLRSAGLTNINLDLIAGLPGQTEASWRESVAAVLGTGVPHVSVYMLEVDDNSRLGAEIGRGGTRFGALDVPSDELIASCYEYAVEELARHGIHRYEISNFARPGFESLHNLKYWKREPYIGFGADAHSFDGLARSQNAETARLYVDGNKREVSRCDAVEEKFFVGLRLSEGVEPDESDWRRFGPALHRFLEGGMMERTGGRLRLTPRGIMISNEIFQEFLPA